MQATTTAGAVAALDGRGEAAQERQAERLHDKLMQEVRGALLTGDAAAVVPHVAINGRPITTMLTEVMSTHMELDDVLKLISLAALGDIAGAAAAAETIISSVAYAHADDVADRLEVLS